MTGSASPAPLPITAPFVDCGRLIGWPLAPTNPAPSCQAEPRG